MDTLMRTVHLEFWSHADNAWLLERSNVSLHEAAREARRLEQMGFTWRIIDAVNREPVTLPEAAETAAYLPPTTEDP